MKNVKFIITIIVLLSLLSVRAFGQVQVVAQVDTSEDIYVGQSFNYMIVIYGDNKPAKVDLVPLAQYNPQNTGNQDESQIYVTSINNKVSKKIIKRYVMSYSLTINKSGQIELPPITVTIDGKKYPTKPIQLNILQPGTTDKLDFDVVLSEQKCYVGQPVIMTVKLYQSDPTNTVNIRFNIPALRKDFFYIEDPETSDPQAQPLPPSTGINALYSTRRVQYKGKDFFLSTFNKVLIPKRSGQIDMGTSSVSAALAVGPARPRDPFLDGFRIFGPQKKYKRFAVNSQPLKLMVLPLPEQDKPEGFYGLVGRYTIDASAEPTKVSVGDPITLTIKIGGSHYLKPVQWPQLEEIKELVQNFKIPSQKASPNIQDGMKIFTQTIRANNDKINEIPSIGLAFFDVDKGEYAVAKTNPIPLDVTPTKILTNADLEGIDPTYINRQVEAIKKGISANYEGPDVLTNQNFSPLGAIVRPGYMVVWSVPFLALVTSSLVKLFTHKSPEKLAQKQKRQAASKAVKQLKKISSLNPDKQQELIVSTMKQYIGERFEKIAGSLTADDCYQIINSVVPDQQIADKFKNTITQCETSRYASIEATIDSTLVNEVINLIQTIEKNSKE